MSNNMTVVKASTFDPAHVTFGEPENIKLNKSSMLKIPIFYEGKPLIIQSPVFKRCTIREFPKKTDDDKNALIMYQNIKYEDEQDYAQNVIGGLSESVKAHMTKNVRTLFNRKKDSMQNLTFNPHVHEPNDYDASIKTTVPLQSRDSMEPAKSVAFFEKAGTPESKKLSWDEMQELLQENNRTLTARTLVQVPYAYIINRQQYGFKTLLSTVDIRDKPEDAVPLHQGGAAVSEAKAPAAVGDAFM